ncbi:hypothetical protein DI005_03250 [Prauserella sp. PE36]|uniref:hypothetical protein n=1 Tax=Prauserella sp. PE36 TaxID=1504709 RepID=UPI000DE2BBF4|nr:hypothetical protein [Prauserella sp. PE36]RBM23521.1 hypothetical protein DI005_03250 [Prauserella sp. PE36]
MRITAEHVRSLLDSGLPEAALALQEGEVLLLSAADLDSPRYAGALVVASAAGLRGQLGDRTPSERELEELAAGLEAGVTNLGG